MGGRGVRQRQSRTLQLEQTPTEQAEVFQQWVITDLVILHELNEGIGG